MEAGGDIPGLASASAAPIECWLGASRGGFGLHSFCVLNLENLCLNVFFFPLDASGQCPNPVPPPIAVNADRAIGSGGNPLHAMRECGTGHAGICRAMTKGDAGGIAVWLEHFRGNASVIPGIGG